MKNEDTPNEKMRLKDYLKNISYNYKNNKAFKALVKLILYLVFFVVIISVVSLGSSSTESKRETTTTTKKTVNYKEILSHIIKDNNTFTYEITLNENDKVIIEYSIKENVLEGVYENKEKTSKFKIEDNKVYELKMNEQIETPELFSNLNINYINIYTLFNLLDQDKALKFIEGDLTKYEYNYEDSKITTIVKEENIQNITIHEGVNDYTISINYKGDE